MPGSRGRLKTNLSPAEVLVGEHPDRAAELIAKSCDFDEIDDQIILGQVRHAKSQYPVQGRATIHNALERPRGTSSTHSQRSESPTSTHFVPPRGKLPPSPPASSSSKSKARTEYVFVAVGEPIKEHRLSVKNASIDFSVIREDIVHNRLQEDVEPTGRNSTPYSGVPAKILISYYKILLTWRRPESNRTHETTFHLVPNQVGFESDILLCDQDSGEGERIHPTVTHAPIPLRPGPDVQSFAPPPVAEAPDARSYHRSSMYGDDFAAHLAQRQAPYRPGLADLKEVQRADEFAAVAAHRQHSPSLAQMPGSRSSSGGRQHLRGQPTAGSSSPLSRAHQQMATSDELRVEFKWDRALRIIDVALNLAGEVFFNSLKREFQRLNNVDRSAHEIFFTQEKSGDESDAFKLSLDQANLETDWESAVYWMKENQRERKPHLYAVIRGG